MASDDELDPTQSQTQDTESNVWLNVDSEPDIWGRLLANNVKMQNYGKFLISCMFSNLFLNILCVCFFDNSDLIAEKFTAGRDPTNNCNFKNVPNTVTALISKQHFVITKDLSDMNNPAYIEVISFVGT